MSTTSPQPPVFGAYKEDALDEQWLAELEEKLPAEKPVCFNYVATRSMILDLAREVVELRNLARRNQALMRSFRTHTYQPTTPCNSDEFTQCKE